MLTVLYIFLGAGKASLKDLFMGFRVVTYRRLGCSSLFKSLLEKILLAIPFIDSDFDRYRRGRLALFSLNVQCLGIEATYGANEIVGENEL